MKTKNVGLAAFAFTLAIGGAFAAFLAPEDVYVRAKLASNPNGPTECVNTGIQCDAQGAQVCTVIVSTASGNQTASTGSATFRPFRGTNCVTQLTNSTATPQTVDLEEVIDRLVAQGQP